MSRHKADVRPRFGRIAVLGASVAITAVAALGGIGVLPSAADQRADERAEDRAEERAGQSLEAVAEDVAPAPGAEAVDAAQAPDNGSVDAFEQVVPEAGSRADETLPLVSGEGRRVVFSESRQRVWLVGADEEVARTYLASGSATDNLDPGTFEVYSRSEDAYGIDDSGTMKYFVRFTQGPTGAAIGFHDIPIDDGAPVQTVSQLGTPLSHGCIRQRRSDAIKLWRFAPLGTTVVVTA